MKNLFTPLIHVCLDFISKFRTIIIACAIFQKFGPIVGLFYSPKQICSLVVQCFWFRSIKKRRYKFNDLLCELNYQSARTNHGNRRSANQFIHSSLGLPTFFQKSPVQKSNIDLVKIVYITLCQFFSCKFIRYFTESVQITILTETHFWNGIN